MTLQLLFLCTGNYYRSRYAEILFNTLAAEMDLNWIASSRGLALEVGVNNVGPMNRIAAKRLQQQGISSEAYNRWPIQVQEADLSQADLIIALDEVEHRPYLTKRFPDWPDRVIYWGVRDLGFVPARIALSKIDQEVRNLAQRLAMSTSPGEMMAIEVDLATQAVLTRTYRAFNARDIETVLEVMHPEVAWPNGLEGGYVYGHQGIRDYWTRQWGLIDPHVEPHGFEIAEDGRIVTHVQQVVRDLDGHLLFDGPVQHIYLIRDGYIKHMEIRT